LWYEDGGVPFYPPANSDHVSYSITNRQHTKDPVRVSARTVSSLAEEYGHKAIELLKLDIEGAEYEVLGSTSLAALGVKVLCVEFHNDYGLRRMISAARSVCKQGFRVVGVRRTDVTFVASEGASL
jgi:hypothetical protein